MSSTPVTIIDLFEPSFSLGPPQQIIEQMADLAIIIAVLWSFKSRSPHCLGVLISCLGRGVSRTNYTTQWNTRFTSPRVQMFSNLFDHILVLGRIEALRVIRFRIGILFSTTSCIDPNNKLGNQR
jgi:hypothetical protein